MVFPEVCLMFSSQGSPPTYSPQPSATSQSITDREPGDEINRADMEALIHQTSEQWVSPWGSHQQPPAPTAHSPNSSFPRGLTEQSHSNQCVLGEGMALSQFFAPFPVFTQELCQLPLSLEAWLPNSVPVP